MDIITSKARFRQQVIKYSLKNGVTKASIRYKTCRQAIYNWQKRYDGTWQSLVERSHRPHHHPKEHTPEEKELILKHYLYYKDDKIRLWSAICKKGYTHSYPVMNRVLNKWLGVDKKKKQVHKPKPYKRAEYPGQKVQIDVKYVPTHCIVNGVKYYQYTAVDECTRWVYREMYEEHSTYSSAMFVANLIKNAPFQIREIQTDNGSEFTNSLNQKKCDTKTLFEAFLASKNIIYHRIRVATPQHNGKVERQHREDEKRFYKHMKMYSLKDGRKQLERYNKLSNTIPKICLGYLSPNQVLNKYLSVM